jgi:two-component system sensor histidine kinase UhpB
VLEVQRSVRTSLEDLRRIAIELRPEALDDLGLESALSVLCDRFAQRSGLDVSCRFAEPLPELPASTELVIYRVAQEALTNVARHAGASTVTVRLRAEPGEVVLVVRDDGQGLPDEARERGMGGMRERAMFVGAELEIASGAGSGTSVTLRVPAA